MRKRANEAVGVRTRQQGKTCARQPDVPSLPCNISYIIALCSAPYSVPMLDVRRSSTWALTLLRRCATASALACPLDVTASSSEDPDQAAAARNAARDTCFSPRLIALATTTSKNAEYHDRCGSGAMRRIKGGCERREEKIEINCDATLKSRF